MPVIGAWILRNSSGGHNWDNCGDLIVDSMLENNIVSVLNAPHSVATQDVLVIRRYTLKLGGGSDTTSATFISEKHVHTNHLYNTRVCVYTHTYMHVDKANVVKCEYLNLDEGYMGVFLQISLGLKFCRLKMEKKKQQLWHWTLDLVRLNVNCTTFHPTSPVFLVCLFFVFVLLWGFGQVISISCQGLSPTVNRVNHTPCPRGS